MARRADIVTAAVAVAVHAVAAIAIAHSRPGVPRARPQPIEVDFRRPVPPPPPPPHALPAARAPQPIARAPRPAARKVALNSTPRPSPPVSPEAAPRPAPAVPVYGISMESPTDAASETAVPAGGATTGAPGGAGRRGSAAAGASGPAGEIAIKTLPEIDTDACGRSIAYPAEAERAGVEGKVRLRVALDAAGRVLSARVLRGLGHGLDQAAVEALTHRCRFTPAIADNGQPVPFVIESYTFAFELPR